MIHDPNISQSFGCHSAAFVGCAWQALMLDLSRWRRLGVMEYHQVGLNQPTADKGSTKGRQRAVKVVRCAVHLDSWDIFSEYPGSSTHIPSFSLQDCSDVLCFR